jgi:hypothetical protein
MRGEPKPLKKYIRPSASKSVHDGSLATVGGATIMASAGWDSQYLLIAHYGEWRETRTRAEEIHLTVGRVDRQSEQVHDDVGPEIAFWGLY